MCLQVMCDIEHIPFSESKMKTGLPIASILTPKLFPQAAENLGFSSKFEELSFNKLLKSKLPKIIILQENDACVLLKLNRKQAEVVIGENRTRKVISLKELKNLYAGYAVSLTVNIAFEERAHALHQVQKDSWFWGAMWRYRSYYLHIIFAALITNSFVLVAPIYIMNVYDRVVPNQAMTTLWMLTIGAAMFFVFDFIARLFRSYLVDLAGRKADNDISNHLFQHMISLRMKNKPNSAGAFANYFNEFEIVRDFFTSASITALIDIPFVFIFLGVIWLVGGMIVLVPLGAIPFVLLIAMLLEIPSRKAIQETLAGSMQKQALLVETITGMETVKTLNAENLMQKKWEHSVTRQHMATNISKNYSNIAINLTVLIQQMVTVGIIVIGVHLILANKLSVGGLVACSILSGRVMQISQIVNISSRLIRTITALKALNKIMALDTEYEDDKKLLSRPELKGHIEFNRVEFNYPDQKIPALTKVHLEIKPGEKIGIIGANGSGKTSILRLISGLYHAQSGIIKIDNTDVREINPHDLRKNIYYASGGSTLFYGSVRENILLANPSIDDEYFSYICDITGVTDFVSKHPLGYDMPVGERGDDLSTGQRQMILLARMFAFDSNIVLLDEITSALDNSLENQLADHLQSFLQEKTAIIVTHRMKLLDIVDRLIVMEAGKIIADGDKNEIIMQMRTPLEEES